MEHLERSSDIDRIKRKSISDGKGEINGAPASMCSAPEKKIDFRAQTWSKRCLELRSIARSIARSTASNTRNRWAGLGRLFVTLIRIGGMSDPTRSLRLLVRYALFLLTLTRRTPFTRFTAACSSPATDMDEQRRPLPARARRTVLAIVAATAFVLIMASHTAIALVTPVLAFTSHKFSCVAGAR